MSDDVAHSGVSPPRYPSSELSDFVAAALIHFGLSPADAMLSAQILVDADLCGIDDHGVMNLANNPHYIRGLRSGHVVAQPNVEVLRETPVSAAWDSGGGFGPLIAHRAMSLAIEKAEASGIGMVTVRNGRHFGANGYFAEMGGARGHVAMVACNTPAVAFAPGAHRPAVGTNPLAFSAPVAESPPLVVDIAMTAAAGAKVLMARRSGEPVPDGWVVDEIGEPTTDPSIIQSGGAFELLGGPVARHKGYGLALMVDALSMLSGGGSGIWQPTGPPHGDWTHGQWFAVWRVDLFVDPKSYAAEMQRLADQIHGLPATDSAGALLPGERRASCRATRAASGIPLEPRTVEALRALASEVGVEFPTQL